MSEDRSPRLPKRDGRLCAFLVLVALVALACGDPEDSSPTGARPTTIGDVTAWPDVGTENMDCVVDYPDDLAKRQQAFAGRVESVEVDEYDEDAGARPARVRFRIEELFRGIVHGDYLVLYTWDFMLPEQDITGARVLAASDISGDLMGCGFTRPYSEQEARMWRETFAALPPEDCGKEVRDCYLGAPSPVPADCTRASFEYAIVSQIDQGNFPFKLIGCNERYLSLRVDLGDCLPEAEKEERRACAREKTAYFDTKNGMWSLLTYEEGTRCSQVQSLEPEFPSQFCHRRLLGSVVFSGPGGRGGWILLQRLQVPRPRRPRAYARGRE